ncbi:outer membrane usher protein [Pseudomonas fragi]|nr:outer membrane usher protein [Pseudomonas fragi]NBF15123.1 fimbria/pilus outer membrane usher protein [Pseudomonas sp. Fl4BN2]
MILKPMAARVCGALFRHLRPSSLLAPLALLSVEALAKQTDSAHTRLEPAELLAQFDVQMLKHRGIDPAVAQYFAAAPRFGSGNRRVELWVNGNPRGQVEARFDDEGQLCFNRGLLDQAGLKIPKAQWQINPGQSPDIQAICYDFAGAWPQTEVELLPNSQQVRLVVSHDALRPEAVDRGIYQSGGAGALINYELQTFTSQSGSYSSNYHSANTELGFNLGDWIVRSSQSFTANDNGNDFQTLYTYGQTTFVEQARTLQVGEINISDSVVAGAPITGLQLVPESALKSGSQGATVDGIAQSQARVEVRQAGALLYTTVVPAGPFRLSDIRLLNSNTDLDVRVIEADGQEQRFTVAAASLIRTSLSTPGMSLAVGKLRTFDSSSGGAKPLIATASDGWLLGSSNKISAGAMLADNNYQALALELDSVLSPTTALTVRTVASKAPKVKGAGGQVSASLSTRVSEKISVNLNTTQQSQGYRDLLDTTNRYNEYDSSGLARSQYGVSAAWSDPVLGSFSSTWSTSRTFAGHSSEYLSASWSKSFPRFSVNASVEKTTRNLNRKEQTRRSRNEGPQTALYLSVSVPLGSGRSTRAYASQRSDRTRYGASFNDSSFERFNYNLAVEREVENVSQQLSANASLLTPYAQTSAGVSTSDDSRSYNLRASGGVVVHEQGVTLSPYPVRDSFAIASVGDVAGIKLQTPSGPVWTDGAGRAVIASLNPYSSTRVEVETKDLPRNIDIRNGHQMLSAARGSVHRMDFEVLKSRRVLLTVMDAKGGVPAKGASVVDANGGFVTSVIDDGQVYLNHLEHATPLRIEHSDDQSCELSFEVPEEQDLESYFETLNASCTSEPQAMLAANGRTL